VVGFISGVCTCEALKNPAVLFSSSCSNNVLKFGVKTLGEKSKSVKILHIHFIYTSLQKYLSKFIPPPFF
jgi:hypothetical protein